MAIKDLLVAYQADKGSRKALEFVLQMARKYGASVTGAYIQIPNRYEKEASRWVSKDIIEIMQRAEQETREKVERTFRDDLRALGEEAGHEWIGLTGSPSLLLARLSRYFDLLVTGQFAIAESGGSALQPEELIRRSGKPAIIVPEAYDVRPFKEEAVVAWDGSSSAARALADAMQILETKKRIDVVTVEAEGAVQRTGWLGDHDVIKHLRRHGIEGRYVLLPRTGSVGRTLLDYCEAHAPDVLVMGAFDAVRRGVPVRPAAPERACPDVALNPGDGSIR
jgi:nucleotide-binding universal stress UspA family protein